MNHKVKKISKKAYDMSKKTENDVLVVPNGKKMVEQARGNLFILVLGGIGGLIYGLKMKKNPYLYTAFGVVLGKGVIMLKKK
jgi:hypothetical protein|tara:strand:- start:2452 stop:2697 length:246 start_codon:yes stop_codon:yes gene_type:complete